MVDNELDVKLSVLCNAPRRMSKTIHFLDRFVARFAIVEFSFQALSALCCARSVDLIDTEGHLIKSVSLPFLADLKDSMKFDRREHRGCVRKNDDVA